MKTCLVVDDSKVTRKVALHILEALGLQGFEAASRRNAITSCDGSSIDVVLFNADMPDMAGMKFLEALKTSSHSERPKVVFYSGEDDSAHIEEALEAGADGYVPKPLSREILGDKLRDIGIL